jgi:hypothetical protein
MNVMLDDELQAQNKTYQNGLLSSFKPECACYERKLIDAINVPPACFNASCIKAPGVFYTNDFDCNNDLTITMCNAIINANIGSAENILISPTMRQNCTAVGKSLPTATANGAVIVNGNDTSTPTYVATTNNTDPIPFVQGESALQLQQQLAALRAKEAADKALAESRAARAAKEAADKAAADKAAADKEAADKEAADKEAGNTPFIIFGVVGGVICLCFMFLCMIMLLRK